MDDLITGNGGYVVFGGSSVGSTGEVDVADLDGSNGFATSGGALLVLGNSVVREKSTGMESTT